MRHPDWQSDCKKVSLWQGDCKDILGKVQGLTFCLDPPYGIGEAAGKNKTRGKLAKPQDYGNKDWDNNIDQEAIDLVLRMGKEVIIFGGNYYNLPPTSCWLVWDKMNGPNDFADCELAWTNLSYAVRRLQFMWAGMMKDAKEKRYHPTQKPVDVMLWCIGFLKGEIICDPFMGSGTTGVAAIRAGRKFWGIEKDPEYFEIAKGRISEELKKEKSSFGLQAATFTSSENRRQSRLRSRKTKGQQ